MDFLPGFSPFLGDAVSQPLKHLGKKLPHVPVLGSYELSHVLSRLLILGGDKLSYVLVFGGNELSRGSSVLAGIEAKENSQDGGKGAGTGYDQTHDLPKGHVHLLHPLYCKLSEENSTLKHLAPSPLCGGRSEWGDMRRQ